LAMLFCTLTPNHGFAKVMKHHIPKA
jgi:hypothetical protein